MISGWIKRKISEASYKLALKDIERFLLILKGQDNNDKAMLLAIATVIRINLRNSGQLPQAILNLEASESDHANAQIFVANLVKLYQKIDQKADAAGAMVWLHSLRCQGYPELRLKGREVWAELSKGFPLVPDSLTEMLALTGNDLPAEAYQEFEFIPVGLEPFLEQAP